ncbi:hypothetical protein BRC71_08180 [Halobacteriales archaeon QH_7_65_31]|nr:MAG: hypothetical protein BRC71_08180 [Halobacteriales archaeon QH_7_65_31]
MSQLVYHHEGSYDGERSPFDEAIEKVSEGQSVRIACPYVSPGVLATIDARAESWQLLTDGDEWLASARETETWEQVISWLEADPDCIRTLDGLHAKVVLTSETALLGSANLTDTGLTRREEMSVVLSDTDDVAELHAWFDGIRSRSTSISPEMVRDSMEWSGETRRSSQSFTSSVENTPRPRATRIRGRHSSDDDSEKPVDDEIYDRLLARIQRAPSRVWVERHLDLMRELIEIAELSESDEQVVTSVPKSGGGIHFTIGSRYVLTLFRHPSGGAEFIISGNSNKIEEYVERSRHDVQFDGENAPPYLLEYAVGEYPMADADFKRAWIRAAVNEVGRFSRSPSRKSHDPLVYQLITDERIRAKVLDATFD